MIWGGQRGPVLREKGRSLGALNCPLRAGGERGLRVSGGGGEREDCERKCERVCKGVVKEGCEGGCERGMR